MTCLLSMLCCKLGILCYSKSLNKMKLGCPSKYSFKLMQNMNSRNVSFEIIGWPLITYHEDSADM